MEKHDVTMSDCNNTTMGAGRVPNLHPLSLAASLKPSHPQPTQLTTHNITQETQKHCFYKRKEENKSKEVPRIRGHCQTTVTASLQKEEPINKVLPQHTQPTITDAPKEHKTNIICSYNMPTLAATSTFPLPAFTCPL